ncbi:MAG TPA: hypothetical protein VG269_16290 [Tepidisphaeraceae bacterium]|jgi:hypothetical protein|nr:hypothetical protein [Tepidisphaeraceae bacterium]
MRAPYHPWILRPRVLAAAAAAVTACASAGFAAALAPAAEAPADNNIQSVTRLLDKDDNDVVIKVEELPKVIRDYIAKDMPDGKITEARKDYKGSKEKKGDNFTYEVEVKQGKKEYEFKFSPEGKLLKKREEAGDDADDKK